MMLIPLKSSWIAVFEGVMYIYSFVRGSLIDRIEILLSIALMEYLLDGLPLEKRPGLSEKAFQRVPEKDGEDPGGEKSPPLCSLRTHTSEDSPGMEFRYCSKCEGSYEYCMDHLYTHKHVKKEKNLRNSPGFASFHKFPEAASPHIKACAGSLLHNLRLIMED